MENVFGVGVNHLEKEMYILLLSKKRGSNYDYDTMVKQQLKIKEQYKV